VKRRDDPNQTQIDWGNPQAPAASASSSFPDPVKLAAEAPPPLIERLPWDFATTFPQPIEQAIEAGRLCEEDCTPENVKSIHEEHARELLTIVHDLDAVMDARRRGVDPMTGKPPRTHASRERLRRLYDSEPDRLDRSFNNMVEVYEEAFGAEAAHAFSRYIRARHAGIPIECDQKLCSDSQTIEKKKESPVVEHRAAPTVLPVPKPLREAVAAGIFGYEESGKPVNPKPDEVRKITQNHAEKIIDLLNGLREVESQLAGHCSDRARVGAERSRLKNQITSAIEEYAASFGPKAGERLDAYCLRQQLNPDAKRTR